MSELSTNKLSPSTGTTLTFGESGDIIVLGTGAIATGFSDSTITKSTNNPEVNTNPPSGVGTLWLNTVTGCFFACTDATTDANVWDNVANDSSSNVTPVGPFGPSQFGYTLGGGVTGDQHFSSRVDKFAYPSGGNAVSVVDMTATRGKSDAGSCTSSTAAYQCCGYFRDVNDNNTGDGGTLKNIDALTKVTFSSDTLSFEFTSLSKTQRSISGVSSSTDGYVGGGFQDSSGGVRKFSFANETSQSTPHNMTKGRSGFFGVQSGTHGYWGGGGNAVGFAPQNDPDFEKFAFASDSSSADVADINPNMGRANSLSGEFQAFFGQDPSSGPVTGFGGLTLFELTFASDNNSVNSIPEVTVFKGAGGNATYYTAGEGWYHGGTEQASTGGSSTHATTSKFSISSSNVSSQQGTLTIARFSATSHGL